MRAMYGKSYSEHRTQTPTPAISLTVKPDRARFGLHVSVEAESAGQAVPLLRRAAQRLEELLPPLQARLEVHDVDLPRDGGKSGGPSTLHATLELPLATDASVWDRAQRVAQVDDLLHALAQEGRRQKPALEVRRDLPAFVVAAPEAHRVALVQRLHERARSLAGDDAQLLGLQFDRAVTQQSLGLEAVVVSLPVEGTLNCRPR